MEEVSDGRGIIQNRERAKQIIDFSGLRFRNITPTDIDGLIEFHNKYWIWIETKLNDTELKHGQRLAFERLCDDLQKAGKPTLFIIAVHQQNNCDKDIDAAGTVVREYRSSSIWRIPTKTITTRKLIEKFLKYHHEF